MDFKSSGIILSFTLFFCIFISATSADSRYLRISAKKCQEYQEFYRETFAARVPGRDPILGKIKCPRNRRVDPDARREVFKHEFPHTASLWYEADSNGNGTFDSFKFRCSGTLVSKRFVLVSAHCIYSKWGKPTHVVLGDAQLFKENADSKRQVLAVEDIIIHPNYVPPSSIDDIALIQLARGAKFDPKNKNPRPSARPACLPTENQDLSAGVALSAFDVGDGALRTERIELFSNNKECEPHLKTNQNFTLRFGEALRPTQVCAKGLRSSTCMTDLGGTLTTQSRSGLACLQVVVGIMALNSESCNYSEDKPFAFTKVEMYLDWLEPLIWPSLFRRMGVLSTENTKNESSPYNVNLEDDY